MSSSDSLSGPETLSQLMDGEWQDIDRSACVAGVCDDAALRARWARWHLVRDVLKSDSPLGDGVPDRALNLGLCDRIRAAIDDEPAYSNVVGFGDQGATFSRPAASDAPVVVDTEAPLAEGTSAGPTFRQGAVGFALAASVAVATVTGLTLWQQGGAPGTASDTTVADATGTTTAASPIGALVSNESLPSTPLPVSVASAPLPGARVPAVELVGNAGSYWVSENASSPDGRSLDEARLNLFLSRHLEQAPSASREGLLPYSRLVGYDERSVAGER